MIIYSFVFNTVFLAKKCPGLQKLNEETRNNFRERIIADSDRTQF
jgi:hypothetical protein